MKASIKTGFSFGITSGIITTLGLIIGLHSGTQSQLAIIGGILTIAIADAFSDALGIHIAEESKNTRTGREIWEATISTFVTKFFFAMTFIVPILAVELTTAIIISITWGVSLIGIVSYIIAKQQKVKPWKTIAEHLSITIVVILATHYTGEWIRITFG